VQHRVDLALAHQPAPAAQVAEERRDEDDRQLRLSPPLAQLHRDVVARMPGSRPSMITARGGPFVTARTPLRRCARPRTAGPRA